MIQPVETKTLGAQYCSYKVGGPIDEPYMPFSLEDAMMVLTMVADNQKPLTVIGGGANTIIASQGIRGVTLLAKRLMSIEPVGERSFLLGAGMPLARVSKLAQDHHLTGAEFMIGVPGTLGGAVTMNAGAMGQETAALVDYAVVYHLRQRKTIQLSHDDLAFVYRKSAINSKEMVVLAAQLTFQPGEAEAIESLMKKSLVFRQQHHPKEPNGGSVFKNPSAQQPMGRLLDEAGAKGWREGGAMISMLHANFIVNTGNATSTDILKLMLRMKRLVKERYGIDAHPENRFLGDATLEEIAIWEELTGCDWQGG